MPVDLNEIKLTTSRNDAAKQIAGLRVNIWPLNEAYKNAVRRSAQERGDSNVNVPTHEMQISFTTEYVKEIAKAFPKLVEQVKEQNKERDPGIMTQNVQDENSHLFKALRNRMSKRLAMLYQPQSNAQTSAYPQQAYNVASNATAYVAPANNETTQPQWGETTHRHLEGRPEQRLRRARVQGASTTCQHQATALRPWRCLCADERQRQRALRHLP